MDDYGEAEDGGEGEGKLFSLTLWHLGRYDWQLGSPEEDVGVSGWSGAEDLTGEVVGLLC